ncbi:MAG: cation-translocating P-type ATPase [Eubacteriales bacterium]
MKYYLEKTESVFTELKTSANGLSSVEAATRLEVNGKNKLAEGKHKSIIARFAEQLLNPMVLVLIAAAIISGVTAAFADESFADVFIIMAVVIINSVLGVIQESKAEKAIEALKEMSSSTSKVLRDGNIKVIKSEDLAAGDVVLLEAGDAVPADARIIECASLKIEEAALTGESVPVEKETDVITLSGKEKDITLGDRRNMLYMGSAVVYGRGRAVICDTGMNTEMGKIADALTNAEQGQTPLQIKLSSLSKILSYLVLGICVFIFAFGIIKTGDLSASAVLSTFMLAVSLAVAAIPEGLAAVVTIVLSIGVTKMSKHNAIIRRLTAVETLGCTQIICSDKTGTLTQNKMTVVEIYGADKMLLAEAMALASDAELDATGNATGEPTECALVNYASKAGLSKNKLKEKAPRIGEAPFDSMRKMMSTVHKIEENIIQYTKGAPDEVLNRCTSYIKDGKIHPLNESAIKDILNENKKMAGKALRVLAAAMHIYNNSPVSFSPDVLEKNLTFIGLTGMIDPIRPEVIGAIAECRNAGIRPIMITGDHRDTAVAIAMQLGIINDPTQAITGSQLSDIDDKTFAVDVEKYSVYARVQPEHKVRIVKAWRARGYITAMTGDGVNDAPSIKSADIGIGMGITGTDVTKNVADMILADDNFATIVKAVGEGRRIYDNVRKAINFLLSSNLSEVIAIFTATILGFTILKPIHLLWINLITDSLPALALGMEKEEPGLMRRKPRSSKEGLFSNGAGISIFYQGLAVAILTVAAYFIGHYIESGFWEITESRDGITMAFLTLSMAEIFHSYNMRSQHISLFKLKTQNFYLFGAMLLSLLLTTLVIYIPLLRDLFSFEYIDMQEYFIALGLAFLIIPIVEAVKFIRNAVRK